METIIRLQNPPPEKRRKRAHSGTGYDPGVPVSVGTLMFTLASAVANGSHWYVNGVTEAASVQALVQRFDERYGLQENKFRKSRSKRAGKAVFRLFVCPLPGKTSLAWWLVRTDGEHPLLSMEKWKDCRDKHNRITWPWWYELVRTPVPVAHRKKMQGQKLKPVKAVTWTWRLTEITKDQLRQEIRRAAQTGRGMGTIVSNLRRAIGNREARVDIAGLYRYIGDQESKHKVPPEKRTEIPSTIPWLSIRKTTWIPLSVLCFRATRGYESWFPSGMVACGTPSAEKEG